MRALRRQFISVPEQAKKRLEGKDMHYETETIATAFIETDSLYVVRRNEVRGQALRQYAREGFELKSTVTIVGNGETTIVDTFQRSRPEHP